MILFFGTRLRRTVHGRGTFPCPRCNTTREYEQVETRSWVHVFWIPVIALGSPAEGVRCTVCTVEWEPAALHGVVSR